MEAQIVQLPTTPDIHVDADRIVIDRLVVRDPSLAAILGERPPEDRPAVVERALRIGLLALQDAGATVDVDLVRTEFEKLVRQAEQVNARAAETLDQVLRANFADGDGRLPRTLERFLGDRGALRAFVNELFDESQARQRDRPDADAARARTSTATPRSSPSCSTRRARTRRCTSSGPRSAASSTGSTTASRRSRPRRPRAAPSGPARRRRAPTSRTSSERCWPTSPARRGRPARPDRARRRAACSAPRRATSC